jgi:DNA-directed RNA polymerase specialized sigma24 family protein
VNRQLTQDLTDHVNVKLARAIDQATDLLSDPEEIRAFLFGITASSVASLIEALARQKGLHPLFAALSFPQQVAVVVSILASMVSPETADDSVQAQSDARAAAHEIHVPLVIERA